MKQKPYPLAIVGCGNVFSRHQSAIENLKNLFQIVSLCDIDPEKSSKVDYQNYEKMLFFVKDQVNLIVIATPNYLHYSQAKLAIESGYDVLIEKPVALSSLETVSLINLAQKHHRKALAVLQVRYNPLVKGLKRIVEEGVLGKIRSVSLVQRWQRQTNFFKSWRGDFHLSGGLLFEFSIHYLDLLQWLFGLPKVLSASGFNLKHKKLPYNDTIFSSFRFPSGAVGNFEITVAAEPANLECSIHVLGEKGAFKISGPNLNKFEYCQLLHNSKKIDYLLNQLNKFSFPASDKPSLFHENVYRDIYFKKGISISESLPSVRLIEDVYRHLKITLLPQYFEPPPTVPGY